MRSLLVLLSMFCVADAIGRTQSIGVKGVLICEDKPAVGVKIKLYEHDKLSPDEHMATEKSDSKGHFLIKGPVIVILRYGGKINGDVHLGASIMASTNVRENNSSVMCPDRNYHSSSGNGNAQEFTSIEPKINIYHDCNDGIKPCQRKVTIHIPSKYINSGKDPKKIFDFGTFQLAGKYEGEGRDCIHRA